MARIVDTRRSPPTVYESVDVLDYLDPRYVTTDARGVRSHALLKSEIPGKLKPGFLYNPDVSAVRDEETGLAKLPARYWKADIKANKLVPMDDAEKAAVDAALTPPPDPDLDTINSILAKGDSNVQATDLKPLVLALARKMKAAGIRFGI